MDPGVCIHGSATFSGCALPCFEVVGAEPLSPTVSAQVIFLPGCLELDLDLAASVGRCHPLPTSISTWIGPWSRSALWSGSALSNGSALWNWSAAWEWNLLPPPVACPLVRIGFFLGVVSSLSPASSHDVWNAEPFAAATVACVVIALTELAFRGATVYSCSAVWECFSAVVAFTSLFLAVVAYVDPMPDSAAGVTNVDLPFVKRTRHQGRSARHVFGDSKPIKEYHNNMRVFDSLDFNGGRVSLVCNHASDCMLFYRVANVPDDAFRSVFRRGYVGRNLESSDFRVNFLDASISYSAGSGRSRNNKYILYLVGADRILRCFLVG
ncbi:hypothetical protein MTO96_051885 [Rhipicephalus appendiculatus]